MITERDLQEAIAECHGVRNPDANTCIKLAAYYTILDHTREVKRGEYSYSAGYESDTEFAQALSGMTQTEYLPILDEMMTALQVLNPRLYAGVMRRLKT